MKSSRRTNWRQKLLSLFYYPTLSAEVSYEKEYLSRSRGVESRSLSNCSHRPKTSCRPRGRLEGKGTREIGGSESLKMFLFVTDCICSKSRIWRKVYLAHLRRLDDYYNGSNDRIVYIVVTIGKLVSTIC